MTPAQQIALWAEQLRDMSALGLYYASDRYDVERYLRIQDLVLEMHAYAGDVPLAALEPLRGPVFTRPMPFPVVDTAVFDDHGRILLIQRADSRTWAMPGGALEVGETPAEGAARETLEETGVLCEVRALVGVFDSRLCGSQTRHHLYQLVFTGAVLDDRGFGRGSHGHEVLDLGWFAQDALPDGLDPGHVSRIPEAWRVWRGDRRPFFD